jgi:hypothetical protein
VGWDDYHWRHSSDLGDATESLRRLRLEDCRFRRVAQYAVELLEDREFHRFLVEPAQRRLIAHRSCGYYGSYRPLDSPCSRNTPKLKEGGRKAQLTVPLTEGGSNTRQSPTLFQFSG